MGSVFDRFPINSFDSTISSMSLAIKDRQPENRWTPEEDEILLAAIEKCMSALYSMIRCADKDRSFSRPCYHLESNLRMSPRPQQQVVS